jgi:homospermidine synthase
MVSAPTDWTPLKDRRPLFDEPWVDQADPWQFANFMIR